MMIKRPDGQSIKGVMEIKKKTAMEPSIELNWGK